ncbi:MAG TPA: hypothetical protein VGN14_18295 [Candidatus Elarobacter sp.]|jgi:hypothetical protein
MRLGRAERFALTVTAFVAFAGAYATAPLSARDWPNAAQVVVPSPAAQDDAAREELVVPVRDPFDLPESRPSSAPARAITALPPIPATLGPLPPNAGAAGTLPPPATAIRVAAVVTGAHPYALVDEGATTRLVAPGDVLGDAPIVAIDRAGVHLRGGALLPPALPATGGHP